MKLNRISTLWEFMPVRAKGYNPENTWGYIIWLLIYVLGIALIVNKNFSWFYTDSHRFLINLIKESCIWWLISAPISFYFAINEIYNEHISHSDKK